jgi:acetyltransferase-like isoleucine patch superfamily enzyme
VSNQFTAGLAELSSRLQRITSPLWRLEARIKGVKLLGWTEFLGRPMISRFRDSRIVLGNGVRIYSAVRSNPLGCPQPCALRTLAPGAQLILGADVGLSGVALCAGAGIEVGEGSIFGSGAMVFDNDFHAPVGEWSWEGDHRTGARPIKIGRGVFIGTRAIILKGVTIGDRAVIGAGAVLTKDVPPHHCAVGNPARIFPQKDHGQSPN